jgi:hypothetical protein
VHSTFGSRSQVLARFENAGDGVAAWVKQLGGIYDSGAAQFTIEQVSEIAGLLVSASGAGYELADVSLRKLNLESVFLLCVRV